LNLCPELRRLASHHARFLAGLEPRAGEDDPGRAARLLALWDEEVLPHCRAEEEVLLPELAARLSEADALVVFTLGDHVVLRQLVRELRAALPVARAAALASFAEKLAQHLEFERRTLFPALQATLGCDRLAALAGEIAETSGGRASPPRSARKARRP